MPVEFEVIFEPSPSNSSPIGTVLLAPRSPNCNLVSRIHSTPDGWVKVRTARSSLARSVWHHMTVVANHIEPANHELERNSSLLFSNWRASTQTEREYLPLNQAFLQKYKKPRPISRSFSRLCPYNVSFTTNKGDVFQFIHDSA